MEYEKIHIEKLEDLIDFEGKYKLFNGSLVSPLCKLDQVEGFLHSGQIGVVRLNAEVRGNNAAFKVGYMQQSQGEPLEKSAIYVYDKSGFNYAVIFNDLTGYDYELGEIVKESSKIKEQLRDERLSFSPMPKRVQELVIKLINRKRKETRK